MKIGHGLSSLAAGTSCANCSLPYATVQKNNLFSGLTQGIEGIAQFTYIKANLSPLDALANHLFANPQRSLPCLALDITDDRCHRCPLAIYQPSRPGIWMISMITPMVWFFFFQDDVIIRRVSLVCFSLFFAATCWQRIAVIFHMYRVFPMMLALKKKNESEKKTTTRPPDILHLPLHPLSTMTISAVVAVHPAVAARQEDGKT